MLNLYQNITQASAPVLNALLARRLKRGKEDPQRVEERKGVSVKKRPEGDLCWIHSASVGESQSALILITQFKDRFPDVRFLVTTGTKTSAELMEKRLPEGAFHQFYPLDHPEWVRRFLDHWRPDLVLWMESEIWPNMLLEVKRRDIPAALVNARLSKNSFQRWQLLKNTIRVLLSGFDIILAQSDTEAGYFKALGQRNVHVTDNLKYSSAPLKADKDDLTSFNNAIAMRPCWVFASTHKGEEVLAARVHDVLKSQFPELLSIIIPRHPSRREEINSALKGFNLHLAFRGEGRVLPARNTDLYVVDTMGELGLFYRAAPIACIGRTFSDDGGGGHNPIEAAQLHCAVLHGPHVQNLQDIFDEMENAQASLPLRDEQHLAETLHRLLSDPLELQKRRDAALKFAQNKTAVIDRVMEQLCPMMQNALIRKDTAA